MLEQLGQGKDTSGGDEEQQDIKNMIKSQIQRKSVKIEKSNRRIEISRASQN